MTVPQPLQSRLIGALFVERGLVSESQIRVALELQRETGQQLGQILVERFGVSRKELASVVAEQWAKLGGSAGPEDNASWRRLGEIFVERGFVSQEELDQALERQRQTGERLGEALVAQGVISKFELAGALAEQMSTLSEKESTDEPVSEQAEATVHHLPRTPDDADVAFGAEIDADASAEGQEHLLAVPAPPTEVVPLNLATRLGLVDARPEAEPEPEQHEAPVEETPEPVLAEVARDDETEPALDDRAGEEVAEPVLAEAAVDDVGEPVRAEAAVEGAPEAQEVTEEVAEPVLADAAVDDVEEPLLAEVAVEDALEVQDDVGEATEPDVGVPVLAEVAVEDALEVQDDVGEADGAGGRGARARGNRRRGRSEVQDEVGEVAEPDAAEPVLAEIAVEDALEVQDDVAEAAEPDVAEPVFAEVAVVEALEVQDDVGEADVAEVATEDEPEPVVAETPAEAPARRPRPLPTLALEDAHEPETSFACVAYAPTRRGYRLVPLVQVPSPGETIDVPDVGERLVLRVGPSPLPDDDRMCAFVEVPVRWVAGAGAASTSDSTPRRASSYWSPVSISKSTRVIRPAATRTTRGVMLRSRRSGTIETMYVPLPSVMR